MNPQDLDAIILGVVRGSDSSVTDQELAEAAGVTAAEVRAVLDRLVGAGLVVQTGGDVRRVFPRKGKEE